MSFKTTYVLFGILGVVLVVFAVTLWLNPLPPDLSEFVLPSLHDPAHKADPSDVTEVTLERNRPTEEKWVFVKDEKTNLWRITEPRELRADQAAVNGLVSQVFQARRASNADKPRKRDDVGLAPAAEVVVLKLKNGKTLRLEVGNSSGGTADAVTYVGSSDLPKEILAVAKSSLDDLKRNLKAYRDRNPLTAREGDIQSVTLVEEKAGKPVQPLVELERRDTRWYYAKPFIGDAERDSDPTAPSLPAATAPTSVQTLLSDLTNLRIDYRSEEKNDFVADNVIATWPNTTWATRTRS